ncbi:putative serine hydrolase Ecym_8223 [Eremothecium cymbalariae DBVPG|uniref:Serine hydrolase domain-containing protein n=1 Tax=Eremothecium cymbalariae (strain CBS 270.75 / DBVPG 7215 / KCTC 17166 / NRRL Y-17582) TaxID=931890 RepID=G8JXD4_ERECY|nr:Hypothetical protein Ecym_8223 [Eremothecium cymbalariae DBVPG\
MSVQRLLFLHGFLQNGKLFSEKSSGIRKLLKKSNIQCDYMDGPVELERGQLPFEVEDDRWEATVDANLNRAWFYHSDVSRELEVGDAIARVREYIQQNGPYDGIVGFSQGAALSSIITNKICELVPGHKPFDVSVIISGYAFTEPGDEGDAGQFKITQRYQDCFKPRDGFNTKILCVYGAADMAVPAERSKYLSEIYTLAYGDEQVKVYEHPGGHMVPNKKDIIRPVVEEINKALHNTSSG